VAGCHEHVTATSESIKDGNSWLCELLSAFQTGLCPMYSVWFSVLKGRLRPHSDFSVTFSQTRGKLRFGETWYFGYFYTEFVLM
jgi:hypothetical protein